MFLASLVFSTAMAAMPPISMILDRTVETAPGPVQYTQTLQFSAASPSVKETWWVNSAKRARVKAEVIFEGKNYTLTKDYENKKVSVVKGTQHEETFAPEEYTENLIFIRDRGDLQQVLADDGIATSEDLMHRYEKKTVQKDSQIYEYFPHPAMVLSRASGTINYLLFKGSYPKSIDKGIWIEQDQFLIRKIKVSADASSNYLKYAALGKTAFFPMERNYVYGPNTVTIKNTSVIQQKGFKYGALEASSFYELPDNAATHAIIEFYQRFR